MNPANNQTMNATAAAIMATKITPAATTGTASPNADGVMKTVFMGHLLSLNSTTLAREDGSHKRLIAEWFPQGVPAARARFTAVRVWIDVSNSPQVLFFKPLVALLTARGHSVDVTTREYAQTLELLDLHRIPYHVVGPRHGGASAWSKGTTMARRVRALRSYAKTRDFDLALSHASHELPLVAHLLGISSAYAFDYEFARVQHSVGSRAASRVVVPQAIPQGRLDRVGASAAKVRRFPGLKEEYYLAGYQADPTILGELGLDRERVLVVVRTPPEVSLYHRHGNPLFAEVLKRLGSDEQVQAVVLPRTDAQRVDLRELALPALIVPEQAIDAQSLVALADLVVSAGGTMNREAAALGVPVYTTFAGRVGAVDDALLAEGRLRKLTNADELEVAKRPPGTTPEGRNPALLLDLLLSALAG
jgi:predicted glycosyltransferase